MGVKKLFGALGRLLMQKAKALLPAAKDQAKEELAKRLAELQEKLQRKG